MAVTEPTLSGQTNQLHMQFTYLHDRLENFKLLTINSSVTAPCIAQFPTNYAEQFVIREKERTPDFFRFHLDQLASGLLLVPLVIPFAFSVQYPKVHHNPIFRFG